MMQQEKELQILFSDRIMNSPNKILFFKWNQSLQSWKECKKQFNPIQITQITSITFNVLFDFKNTGDKDPYRDNVKYSKERYEKILEKLCTESPTFITLNEVTDNFVRLAQDCSWVKSQYYISQNRNVDIKSKYAFRNFFMSKIHPVCLHLYYVPLLPRPIPIAFFSFLRNGNQLLNLTISSVHLSAYKSNSQKRKHELNYITNYLYAFNNEINVHILQGDLNLHSESQNLIWQKLEWKDVWLQFNNLNDNPGFTFDGQKNSLIKQIYWGWEQRRMRLDRVLVYGSIIKPQEINVIFDEPIYENDKLVQNMGLIKSVISFAFDMLNTNIFRNKTDYLFYSDHFGLKTKFKFKSLQINSYKLKSSINL